MMFHSLFTPSNFMRLATRCLPWLLLMMALCFGIGFYQAFFSAPADYQQGNAVRIMYIHVPAAWMSLFVYSIMAALSVSVLVFKNPLADTVAQNAAPLGAVFTAITLITGAIWGKPMWGTWWVWDARLTSMLILFFFYVGYIVLSYSMEQTERTKQAAAILALVGFINVPIVKFSVDFWNTLHQPASILRMGGPSIHSSMLTPLLCMIFAHMAYFFSILILRVQKSLLLRKLIRLEQQYLNQPS